MTSIFYDLQYRITAPGVLPEIFCHYRKETNLTFPPPLGTKVFVHGEREFENGDYHSDGDFFEVVGYEHGIGDSPGDSYPDGRPYFIVELRLGEDDPKYTHGVGMEGKPHLFGELLLKMGWYLP